MDLADLPLVLVDIVGLDAEGLAVRQLVQVGAGPLIEVAEGLELPLLVGQPRLHPALDVGQVGHHQLAALGRHDAATDGRAGQLHHVVGDQVGAPRLERRDALLDDRLLERGPGQVLGLEEPPGPAASARRAVELQGAAQAAISAGAPAQHLVLAGAGGAGLQPHREQLTQRRVDVRAQQLFHRGHLEVGHVDAVVLKYV